MVNQFLTGTLFVLTILSGAVSILALIGWFYGAEDAKTILLFTGALFFICAIIVSLIKDGWKKLFGEVFASIWSF